MTSPSTFSGGLRGQVPVQRPQWPCGTPTVMATHSPLGTDPFSSMPLPLHYHRESLKEINKYEKQLIFFSLPSFFLCLTETFCLTCLTGITQRWDTGLPPLSTLPSARSAILRLRAVLFINLADAITSSGLAHVHPVLGTLRRLLLPLRSPHKHPSRSQPKLRLQLYHAVSGKQKTIEAGSPASMVPLRALNRENS